MLSRLIWGARASMQAGFFATVLAMVIAVPIGLVAGYYRGWVDTVIARVTDVLLAFPFIILAVGLAAILGPSLTNATIALGVGAVPGLIRIARGETLALREEDFVPAAVANGANDLTIIFRHILPNMTSTLLVQATRDDSRRDRRRGGALVPRPRRPAADAVVGHDAPGRAVVPRAGAATRRLSRDSRSCSRRSRSTCSATACATSSIRGRRADGRTLARGDRSLGSLRDRRRARARGRQAVVHARRRARCSGSSASRAAGRASRACRSCGCCPRRR